MYRPMTEQRVYLLDRRLANQLDAERQLRESDPPPTCEICTEPGVRCDSNGWRCLAHLHTPAQLDLDGNAIPVASNPPPTSTPRPDGGAQLGLALPPMSVRYRSPGWGGTVTQPPLGPAGEGSG